MKQEFLERLNQLNSADEPWYVTEKLFYRLFDINRQHIVFTEDERKHVGELLHKTLPLIEKCIGELSLFMHHAGRICSANIIRSAVQFLVDDYGDFPISADDECTETLSDALQKLAQSDAVAELDEKVHTWNNGGPGMDDVYDYSDVVGVGEMPDSHTWWKEMEKLIPVSRQSTDVEIEYFSSA